MRYRFGVFVLDEAQYELRRNGAAVRVEPRVLDLLLFLVRHRDRVVPREELLDTLWKEKFIGEAALTRCVMEARKAIAVEGEEDPIKTVHRRGYRFVLAVTEESEATEPIIDAPSVPSPPTSDPATAQHLVRDSGRRPIVVAGAVLIAAVTLLAAIGVLRRTRPEEARDSPSFRVSPNLKITRLTTSGKAIDATVSPDGRYVAYVVDDGGVRSIRMRQVATGTDTELVSGVPRPRKSLTFTADGNYLAYLEQLEPGTWALHQVAALGGDARRLIETVHDSPWSKGKDVSFAPDGKRVAFIRRLSPERTALYVAYLDRGDEREIVARNGVLFRPLWTPDGKTLLCHWKVPGYSTEIRLVEVPLAAPAAAREISAPNTPLFVAHSMLPDARHLVGVGGQSLSSAAIYLARYPSMELTPITQGVAYWQSPSASQDGRRVVAVRIQENFNLWTATEGDAEALQLTSDADAMEGTHGIAVTPRGEIVYTSKSNGEHNHVWIASADGRRVRQLTSGEDDEYWPAVSPPASAVFYGQRHTQATRSMHIWRMDLETGRARQLTAGGWDMLPAVTPDGRTLIYTDGGSESPVIKRIPSSGGAARTIAPGILFAPTVSPDGKRLAGFHARTMSDSRALVTMDLETGRILDRFPIAPGPERLCVAWVRDGSGLIVVRHHDGVDNLWLQPLGGGTPRQLTSFRSLEIRAFNILSDGKTFVFSRGKDESDVLMFDEVLSAD